MRVFRKTDTMSTFVAQDPILRTMLDYIIPLRTQSSGFEDAVQHCSKCVSEITENDWSPLKLALENVSSVRAFLNKHQTALSARSAADIGIRRILDQLQNLSPAQLRLELQKVINDIIVMQPPTSAKIPPPAPPEPKPKPSPKASPDWFWETSHNNTETKPKPAKIGKRGIGLLIFGAICGGYYIYSNVSLMPPFAVGKWVWFSPDRQKWTKGFITRRNCTGTYAIVDWKSQFVHDKVRAEWVAPITSVWSRQNIEFGKPWQHPSNDQPAGPNYRINDHVQFRSPDEGRWKPGRITSQNKTENEKENQKQTEKKFEVMADDPKEDRVHLLRLAHIAPLWSSKPQQNWYYEHESASSPTPNVDFKVGDRVQAKWSRGTCWLQANIVRISHDGKYDVRHLDGALDSNLQKKWIAPAQAETTPGLPFRHAPTPTK